MSETATLEKPSQSGEEDAPAAAAGVKRAAPDGEDGGSNKKTATADGEKEFEGGCHCGRVRYTVSFNPIGTKAYRCNCTWCQKLSLTMLSLEDPKLKFKLVKPASKSEVDDYSPKTKSTEAGTSDGHRYFCSNCGVYIWNEGWYTFGDSNRHDYFTVNLASIDQPQDGIDLSEVQVSYIDGLNDNQAAGLRDKPWSGGLP